MVENLSLSLMEWSLTRIFQKNLLVLLKIHLASEEALDKVFQSHDIGAVIHFAANSLVAESRGKPYEYYYNNVCMLCLLGVMKEINVNKIGV